LVAIAAFAATDLQSSTGPAGLAAAGPRPALIRSAGPFVLTDAVELNGRPVTAQPQLQSELAHVLSVRPLAALVEAVHEAAVAGTGTAWAARPSGPRVLAAALTRSVPGRVAKIYRDGLAAAPADAPLAVQQAIWAGNQLIGQPYLYGGGHGSFISDGYDCSGSVSFALHGGNLLSAPLDSSEFVGWARAGRGRWMTIYTSYGHAFLEIAGIRLDTSTAGDPDGLNGPRWRPLLASTAGYLARHPAGY
jgi:hypothetical protein